MAGYFAGFSGVPKFSARVTLNPANVVTATAVEQTFTVKGLRLGMLIMVNPVSAFETGLVMGNFRVTAKDTLGITFANPTIADINPASQDVLVIGL